MSSTHCILCPPAQLFFSYVVSISLSDCSHTSQSVPLPFNGYCLCTLGLIISHEVTVTGIQCNIILAVGHHQAVDCSSYRERLLKTCSFRCLWTESVSLKITPSHDFCSTSPAAGVAFLIAIISASFLELFSLQEVSSGVLSANAMSCKEIYLKY